MTFGSHSILENSNKIAGANIFADMTIDVLEEDK